MEYYKRAPTTDAKLFWAKFEDVSFSAYTKTIHICVFIYTVSINKNIVYDYKFILLFIRIHIPTGQLKG